MKYGDDVYYQIDKLYFLMPENYLFLVPAKKENRNVEEGNR